MTSIPSPSCSSESVATPLLHAEAALEAAVISLREACRVRLADERAEAVEDAAVEAEALLFRVRGQRCRVR